MFGQQHKRVIIHLVPEWFRTDLVNETVSKNDTELLSRSQCHYISMYKTKYSQTLFFISRHCEM